MYRGRRRRKTQVVVYILKCSVDLRIRLLHGKQRHVKKGLVVVDSITAANYRPGISLNVPGKTHTRREVVLIILGNLAVRIADDLQSANSTIICLVRRVHEPDVHVVTNTKIQCKPGPDLPVVLEISRVLLCAISQIEIRIAARKQDVTYDSNSREVSLRATGDADKVASDWTRSNLSRIESLRKLT